MNVSITKGGKNLIEESRGFIPSSPIKIKQQSTSSDNTNQKSNNASIDYIVVNAYNSAARALIPVDKAASIITGRLRVKFVEGIKSFSENDVSEIDISSIKYLDEVLFNDLEYIICSVMRFTAKGSCITLSQCMKMIRDTAKMVDYKIDQESYNEMEKIMKVVYNE